MSIIDKLLFASVLAPSQQTCCDKEWHHITTASSLVWQHGSSTHFRWVYYDTFTSRHPVTCFFSFDTYDNVSRQPVALFDFKLMRLKPDLWCVIPVVNNWVAFIWLISRWLGKLPRVRSSECVLPMFISAVLYSYVATGRSFNGYTELAHSARISVDWVIRRHQKPEPFWLLRYSTCHCDPRPLPPLYRYFLRS